MGEARNKRVDVLSLDFGTTTKLGLLEECIHPAIWGEGWRDEREQRKLSKRTGSKKKPPQKQRGH